MNLIRLHIDLLCPPSDRFSFDFEQELDCLIWDVNIT